RSGSAGAPVAAYGGGGSGPTPGGFLSAHGRGGGAPASAVVLCAGGGARRRGPTAGSARFREARRGVGTGPVGLACAARRPRGDRRRGVRSGDAGTVRQRASGSCQGQRPVSRAGKPPSHTIAAYARTAMAELLVRRGWRCGPGCRHAHDAAGVQAFGARLFAFDPATFLGLSLSLPPPRHSPAAAARRTRGVGTDGSAH